MTRKWAKRSNGMLFTGGMLTGLVFLLFVPKDTTSHLQLLYAQVFRGPLAAGKSLRQVSVPTTVRAISPKDYEALRQTCEQYRNGAANLRSQLQEANQRIAQLTKLRAKPAWEHMRLIPADIITPLGQTGNSLFINQGQDSGVAEGHYVISFRSDDPNQEAVIGTITGVSAKGAKVRLITDPDSKIPVSIGTLKTIMEGRGDGTARIGLVPEKYTIRPGNVVYAEKRQGFLDVAVITAEVLGSRKDPDRPVVQEITVRPACDLAGLSEVVVIAPALVR